MSARIGATPYAEVRYWTADDEGQRQIYKWLVSELETEGGVFYASFLNWCIATVDKLKNPAAKWVGEERAMAERTRGVLREQPLDVRDFVELMESYKKGSWKGGLKTGQIGRPQKPDPRATMAGDKRLREMVWTQAERIAMMMASGEKAPSRKMQKKLNNARHEARMAEEERRLEAAQRKAINDAVEEVEEEIEVDDAAAAMGGVAIGQKQPWEQHLADRTKD